MITGRINVFGLTDRDMDSIKKIFSQYPEVKLVHIFGSRAKGNFNSGSDIDLALMNSGISEQTIAQLKNDFEESSLPYFVDLIYFTPLTHQELIDHINRVGVLFYKAEENP